MIGSSSPYDIVRKEEVCAATGRSFVAGEPQIAVLVETPGEETLARLIYSVEAWDAGARPEPPARVFGFWRRTAGEEKKQSDPVMSPEELFDLFEQLGEADQPRQISFRYMLALLLMRKRRLVYDGAIPGDPPRFRVKARPGGHEYEVVDPRMDEATIAEAIEELGRVMNVEEEA
ncbi:MAG: hypothetical protein D6692_03675 [Planctomycetota bacterium]|nr:MAG: hypothetical protein D6692_03675 [Planctomycetota bacterium]